MFHAGPEVLCQRPLGAVRVHPVGASIERRDPDEDSKQAAMSLRLAPVEEFGYSTAMFGTDVSDFEVWKTVC